eukprot:5110889-Pleurochrysis_carterae.AAC.1
MSGSTPRPSVPLTDTPSHTHVKVSDEGRGGDRNTTYDTILRAHIVWRDRYRSRAPSRALRSPRAVLSPAAAHQIETPSHHPREGAKGGSPSLLAKDMTAKPFNRDGHQVCTPRRGYRG